MIYGYSDGATSNNEKGKGIGGIGWLILDEKENIVSYGADHTSNTTNNECELLALITLCHEIVRELDPVDAAIIYSDSAYCINCYEQKWWSKWENNGWINSKKEPVKNKELWELLIPYFKDKRFTFKKVKGHSDNKNQHTYWNNYVDQLAVKAKSLIQ